MEEENHDNIVTQEEDDESTLPSPIELLEHMPSYTPTVTSKGTHSSHCIEGDDYPNNRKRRLIKEESPDLGEQALILGYGGRYRNLGT